MERNKTMKNKYFTFVALAAAALATSCTSDDLAGQQQTLSQNSSQTVTLTASVDEEQTRTGMTKDENDNSKAKFYWHKGDAISVLSGFSLERLYTEDADGTTTAKFTGNVTGTVGPYALYPYNEKHKVDVSTVTVTYNLPATYTYNKVDGNIFYKDGSTSYSSNSTNMPMYGTITNGSISFKHIGGLAVIRIDQMPAASGTLTVTADQQLSGGFKIDMGNRNIATTATDVDDDKKVTFTFSGATKDGVGVFYLPLATGDYTNLTIKVTCDGTTQTIPYGSLTVARKDVTAIPLSTNSKGNLRYFVKNNDGSYTINGHKFIDLGLPSGLLWATMNVGADTETAYGNYYAWGETKPKNTYTEGSYTYKDSPTTLDAEHDAATANWGSGVRMPTKEDFNELKEKCTGKWDGTKNGYTFTYNNNSIFLPAAGFIEGGAYYYQDEYGLYWSSTPQSSEHTNYFNISGDGCVFYLFARYCGLTIRPVATKQ